MEFRTKWELLEYLGQDKKYVRLIDRMIVKGEVKLDRWWYIYEKPEDEEIKKLREDNEKLKERIHELEEVCKDSLFWDNKEDTVKNDDDLNTATVQRHYYEDLYNQEVADKQNRIRKAFRWIKMIKPTANWEEFKDWIMSDEE